MNQYQVALFALLIRVHLRREHAGEQEADEAVGERDERLLGRQPGFQIHKHLLKRAVNQRQLGAKYINILYGKVEK